jgi:hypothetical protein
MASDVSEGVYDLDMAVLRELMEMVWLVEEIPMAKIQDLCEDHVIEHYKFASLWNKLLDESHKVMARIEERMEAIPGSEL